MRFRPLFLVLPVSAVVICGLVAWRLTRPKPPPIAIVDPESVRPAPLFELRDEQGRPVRLSSSVGRSKILVVFFRTRESFEDSALLGRMRERLDDLKQAAPAILAVGPDQSAVYRGMIERSGPIGVPVLSDFLQVQARAWGILDPKTGKPREAVFVIDGTGLIRA